MTIAHRIRRSIRRIKIASTTASETRKVLLERSKGTPRYFAQCPTRICRVSFRLHWGTTEHEYAREALAEILRRKGAQA